MDHEENTPLIAFTTLTPLAVGGVIGLLMQGVGGFAAVVVFAVGLLAMIASVFHLGHPARMLRSLMAITTSWLSREVAMFGLFLACLTAFTLCVQIGALRSFAFSLGIAASVAGILSLLASGKLYELPSRPAWNHWTAVLSFPMSVLSGGLPLGIFISALALPSSPGQDDLFQTAIYVALAGLVLSVLLTALRLGRLRRGSPEERESWSLASGRYLWVLVLRVVASAVAFALLAAGGPGLAAAWLPAVVGEGAERLLFFRAVVPVSMPARAGAPRFVGAHVSVQTSGSAGRS